MQWPKDIIAKFPRLTDNFEKAIAIRALAAKAYAHYMPETEWDEECLSIRETFCS